MIVSCMSTTFENCQLLSVGPTISIDSKTFNISRVQIETLTENK